MNRSEALTALLRMAHGLGLTVAGVGRLLERVSSHDESEALRDYLAETGAQWLLDVQAGPEESS